MKAALFWNLMLCLTLIMLAIVCFRSAARSGDDFGAAIFAWVMSAFAVLSMLGELVLLVIFVFTR